MQQQTIVTPAVPCTCYPAAPTTHGPGGTLTLCLSCAAGTGQASHDSVCLDSCMAQLQRRVQELEKCLGCIRATSIDLELGKASAVGKHACATPVIMRGMEALCGSCSQGPRH